MDTQLRIGANLNLSAEHPITSVSRMPQLSLGPLPFSSSTIGPHREDRRRWLGRRRPVMSRVALYFYERNHFGAGPNHSPTAKNHWRRKTVLPDEPPCSRSSDSAMELHI